MIFSDYLVVSSPNILQPITRHVLTNQFWFLDYFWVCLFFDNQLKSSFKNDTNPIYAFLYYPEKLVHTADCCLSILCARNRHFHMKTYHQRNLLTVNVHLLHFLIAFFPYHIF